MRWETLDEKDYAIPSIEFTIEKKRRKVNWVSASTSLCFLDVETLWTDNSFSFLFLTFYFYLFDRGTRERRRGEEERSRGQPSSCWGKGRGEWREKGQRGKRKQEQKSKSQRPHFHTFPDRKDCISSNVKPNQALPHLHCLFLNILPQQ